MVRAKCLLSWTLLAGAGLSFFTHEKRRGGRHDPFVGQLKRDLNSNSSSSSNSTEYDYIVVGSGPGGAPLAANLAIAGFKVLLIEAGGDSGEAIKELVPAFHFLSAEFEETAWSFYVKHFKDPEQQKRDEKMVYRLRNGSQYIGLEPAEDAEALGILYPRAGTLGGCSRHNSLITMLPHDSDWEHLARITGDHSWLPDRMREHFIAIEDNHYLSLDAAEHGHHGWLSTSLTWLGLVLQDVKFLNLVLSGVTAGGHGLLGSLMHTVTGLSGLLGADLNAPGQTSRPGVYQVPIATRNGVRSTPRELLLNTAHAVNADGTRKYHLDIKLRTLVSKVIFDRTGPVPRAVGVEYLEGANLYRAHHRSASAKVTGRGEVRASREVILSAGTFNTPQILKLSGVGPEDELKRFGIPLVKHLPGVGANMQDRYEHVVIGESEEDYVLTHECTFGLTADDPCLEKWKAGRGNADRGPYATNGAAIAAVLKSSVAEGEPDVVVLGAPAAFVGFVPGYAMEAIKDKRHWSWVLLKAHSRNRAGTVTLRGTDPRDPPEIEFDSFATGGEADLQALYEGLQWARRAFERYVPVAGAFRERMPGANRSEEAEVKRYLRDGAWGHHASCTAAIGAEDDPMAVLDSAFRVRGLAGLRVVDASAFNRIPGFFPTLPIYMLSQKASGVIIADAKKAGSPPR